MKLFLCAFSIVLMTLFNPFQNSALAANHGHQEQHSHSHDDHEHHENDAGVERTECCDAGGCCEGDCEKGDCTEEDCTNEDCRHEKCCDAGGCCEEGRCEEGDCTEPDCTNEDCPDAKESIPSHIGQLDSAERRGEKSFAPGFPHGYSSWHAPATPKPKIFIQR